MKILKLLAMLLALLMTLSSCSFWKDNPEETRTDSESDESVAESVTEPESDSGNEESSTPAESESGSQTEEDSESESWSRLPVVDPPDPEYTLVEDLKNDDRVIAVQGVSGFSVSGYKGYEVLFNSSSGIQIATDVYLPSDYESGTRYPIVLYFADRVTGAGSVISGNDLVKAFSSQKVTVIRFYRGQGASRGAPKAWGGDFADVTDFISIIANSEYLKYSPIYAVGSGIGSIAALRLAATDTDNRVCGCAVTNPIADLKQYMASDETLKKQMIELIRPNNYNKNPDQECYLRSAVSFGHQIRVPVLVVKSEQSVAPYPEQADLLIERLTELGKRLTVITVSSDTTGFFSEDSVTAFFRQFGIGDD